LSIGVIALLAGTTSHAPPGMSRSEVMVLKDGLAMADAYVGNVGGGEHLSCDVDCAGDSVFFTEDGPRFDCGNADRA
jgi:hypothetical protein